MEDMRVKYNQHRNAYGTNIISYIIQKNGSYKDKEVKKKFKELIEIINS